MVLATARSWDDVGRAPLKAAQKEHTRTPARALSHPASCSLGSTFWGLHHVTPISSPYTLSPFCRSHRQPPGEADPGPLRLPAPGVPILPLHPPPVWFTHLPLEQAQGARSPPRPRKEAAWGRETFNRAPSLCPASQGWKGCTCSILDTGVRSGWAGEASQGWAERVSRRRGG